MVRGKEAKISALVYVVVASILCFVPAPVECTGIYIGAPFWGYMLYPFFHANVMHAAVNMWCLLSVVFIYDVSAWSLLLSYMIATIIPDFLLTEIPTLGLSGVCYALMGRISLSVRRKWYYQAYVLFFIGVGFLFPGVNARLHLYCYAIGFVLAILNMPIERK